MTLLSTLTILTPTALAYLTIASLHSYPPHIFTSLVATLNTPSHQRSLLITAACATAYSLLLHKTGRQEAKTVAFWSALMTSIPARVFFVLKVWSIAFEFDEGFLEMRGWWWKGVVWMVYVFCFGEWWVVLQRQKAILNENEYEDEDGDEDENESEEQVSYGLADAQTKKEDGGQENFSSKTKGEGNTPQDHLDIDLDLDLESALPPSIENPPTAVGVGNAPQIHLDLEIEESTFPRQTYTHHNPTARFIITHQCYHLGPVIALLTFFMCPADPGGSRISTLAMLHVLMAVDLEVLTSAVLRGGGEAEGEGGWGKAGREGGQRVEWQGMGG